MNKRKRYLELFDLPEDASSEEIKKRYKLLAKKYHPDKNKSNNATELFQLINEGYTYLQNSESQNIFQYESKNVKEEEIRMDRIRKAKERLREQQLKEELKIKEKYSKITSGIRWKIFSVLSYLCLITGIILLIEPILPIRYEEAIISSYSENFNGLVNDEVTLFETEEGQKIFIESDLKNKLYSNDTVFLKTSKIFHNPTQIVHQNKGEISIFNVDFSITTFFPFVSFFLFLPYYIKRKKNLSISYILAFNFGLYFVESISLITLISNNRWFHLLTFGLV
jgi:hypothetical protein